jgi:hypothetical protein
MHPAVAKYIEDVMTSFKQLLEAGTVQQLVILIVNSDLKPVEKFVFEVVRCTRLSSTFKYGVINECFVVLFRSLENVTEHQQTETLQESCFMFI